MIQDVNLRVGDVELVFEQGRVRAYMKYEIYHAQGILDNGTIQDTIPTIRDLNKAMERLEKKANQMLMEFKSVHDPVWHGLSAFDMGMVLNNWWFDGDKMSHPLCGEFVTDATDLKGRVDDILDHVLPPSAWIWAEYKGGELRVRCAPVKNATSYNVYNSNELLMNIKDHTWHGIVVEPGTYTIRVAPVQNLQIGTPSFPVTVTVPGELPTGEVLESNPLRTFWRWVLYGA